MLCINPDKDWVDVIGALGPIILAFGMGYVAYQQWQTSKKAHRAKFLDITIRNYHKLVEAQSKAASHDNDKLQLALRELSEICSEAKLCLTEEVSTYVQKILDQALEIDRLRARERIANSEEERRQHRDAAFSLEVALGFEQPLEIYRTSLDIN